VLIENRKSVQTDTESYKVRRIIFASPIIDTVGLRYSAPIAWGDPPIKVSRIFELIPINASEVRTGLFRLITSGEPDAAEFANTCLEAIDKMRDEHGHVDTEPRRPDITSNVPWPRVELNCPNVALK
jgi:hypothetical protein